MSSAHIDDDDLDDEEDDDTVVGNCLHCNAPPPSKNSTGSNVSAITGNSGPCPYSNHGAAAMSVASASSSAAVNGGRVQVSCDDCRSFICDACHWCHEFQANHEIRVCDRCDAFYCRACDEMDQCEDCGEVVCSTCTTLMSCKFCGCGLCEDCATACGRCGIVLCARDAKFAVECDTCKMSYCLVCLASGTKDPCVRCGHRPSKRVEQLVHLRLKSIYKAFKQSGASVSSSSGNGGSSGGGALGPGPPISGTISANGSSGGGGCSYSDAPSRNAAGRDTSTIGGKYSSALRSLTENESLGCRGVESSKESLSNFDQSMANEVAAVLQTASNAMASTDAVESENVRRTRGKRATSHPSSSSNEYTHTPYVGGSGGKGHRPGTSSVRNANMAAERYFRKTQAEMEAAAAAAEAEAEAAAAALLAELDEEKATADNKKNKKKKKKKDKKKASNPVENEQPQENSTTPQKSAVDKNVEKSSQLPNKGKSSKKSTNPKTSSQSPPEDDDSTDDEMNFEQLVVRSKTNSRPSKKEKEKEKEKEKKEEAIPEKAPDVTSTNAETPQVSEGNTELERELAEFIANEDEEGLESYLANLKGVPGLAVLRKNAKKALKKLREAKVASLPPESENSQLNNPSHKPSIVVAETEVHPLKTAPKSVTAFANARNNTASIPGAAPATTTTTASSIAAGTPHEPLLRVVSRTQSSIPTTSNRGSGSAAVSVPASARAECVMHMSPAVVGWVIGKGGQRIRDMMEESGAKIWIDQESMGPKESRVVYVSGKRSAVDTAVRMVKDLVAKAPVAASAAAAQGIVPVPTVVTPSLPVPPKSTPHSVPTPTVQSAEAQTTASFEAGKEQQSFAAAISSKQPNQVAVTSAKIPAPAAALSPAQGWPLLDASGSSHGSTTQHSSAKANIKETASIGGVSVVNDQPKSSVGLTPDSKRTQIAFDPRFVALLIGRQGWTIKNIQSESGASLVIDQATDPPKIIIFGRPENVTKAEKLVRDVLKYPNIQDAAKNSNNIGLEGISAGDANIAFQGNLMSQGIPDVSGFMNNIGQFVGPHGRNGNDLGLHPENSPLLSMPISTNFPRDSTSSTPDLIDGLSFQHAHTLQSNVAQAAETTNFPSSYTSHQREGSLGIFQESFPDSQIPNYLKSSQNHSMLPHRHSQPASNTIDPKMHSQPQEWVQPHSHNQLPPQYSSHSQYSVGPMNDASYSSLNQHSVGRRASHDIPRSLNFVAMPADQSHLLQNLDSARLTPVHTQQGTSNEMGNFLSTANTNQNLNNGWEQEIKGAPVGESWNHNQNSSAAGTSHFSGFNQHNPLDNDMPINPNVFDSQPHNINSIGQSESKPIPDDSQFVDSMFDSLGVQGSGGDGLLSALNSVSLGGVGSQQGSNWGNAITGWGSIGQDSDNSSFLQHSRLGGIAMNSPNQESYSSEREKR